MDYLTIESVEVGEGGRETWSVQSKLTNYRRCYHCLDHRIRKIILNFCFSPITLTGDSVFIRLETVLFWCKIGLQNCLKHLESFCSTWLLKVNLKKTKIMIFQKCGRKPKNLHFYYQNQLTEIVQEYT